MPGSQGGLAHQVGSQGALLAQAPPRLEEEPCLLQQSSAGGGMDQGVTVAMERNPQKLL